MSQAEENDSQLASELVQPALPAHLSQPQLWDRQPRESDREWQLFSLYRLTAYPKAVPGDLGPYTPRHMGRFARDIGLSEAHIYRVASQNSWSSRVNAYDRAIGQEQHHATLSDLERMRADQRQELHELRQVTCAAIARMRDDMASGVLQLKPSEIAAFVRLVQDSERLLNGEATSRTESKSLSLSVALNGASPEVIAWHRKIAEEQLGAGT